MTIVTFIRHGESEDNVKQIWAGWKDAPLSELGRKQAQALGQSLSSTPITHIYASPLLRAHATGQSVHHHQPHPKPPFQVNPHLREQHFGIAEGHPWVITPPENVPLEQLYAQKVFPVLYQRDERFPEAESLDDLAARADVAIKECVLPHVPDAPHPVGQDSGVHIAIASHGLCIAELVGALLRLDPEADKDENYAGLMNTAWTRVVIRVKDGHHGPVDPSSPPPFEVRVTHVNKIDHLEALQKDDPAVQSSIDGAKAEAIAFFGGGGAGEKTQNGGASL
ncbi:phosphoglycerate mutase [Crassisporium funariophilum]|nr:phosphoglycerate mutase [Crassisporium funariophilum]